SVSFIFVFYFMILPHTISILFPYTTLFRSLTSNSGSEDFQKLAVDKDFLFERVLKNSQTWKNSHNLMYVVGATQADYFAKIRERSEERRVGKECRYRRWG